jgi:hypothetical protein
MARNRNPPELSAPTTGEIAYRRTDSNPGTARISWTCSSYQALNSFVAGAGGADR